MANYKINFIKLVELNNGKVKKSATLTDDQGAETKFVTIWPDFLNFANLAVGQVVEGELKTVQNGQYTNSTLYPLNVAPKPQGGAFRGSGIAKAQETKAQNIHVAQQNKEEGIKTSSTIRMAVDCALVEYEQPNNLDELQTLIKKWRSWFIANWNLPNSPVDMDGTPF